MLTSTRIDIPQTPSLPVWSTPPTSTEGPSFQDLLMQSLQKTASYESKAQGLITESVTGGDVTMVEASMALREADLALRMMMQVRNKLLDAYNEIKQMQF